MREGLIVYQESIRDKFCHFGLPLKELPLIDTIAVSGPWPLKLPFSDGRHHLGALRIWVNRDRLTRFEVSLPRLLFGHNGMCLADQSQIDSALEQCAAKLKPVASVDPPNAWMPFRLDLAWNFNLPARPLIMSHCHKRIAGIQKPATLFHNGEGVSWRNSKSRYCVSLYDKERQMHVKGEGNTLRAEVSFRGRRLNERLDGAVWSRFEDLYLIFRQVMLTLPPIATPVHRCTRWTLAISQQPRQVRKEVLAALSHHRSIRKWEREVEDFAAVRQVGEFSWIDQLPVDGPPEPKNVEPPKRRTKSRKSKSETSSSGPELKNADAVLPIPKVVESPAGQERYDDDGQAAIPTESNCNCASGDALRLQTS